MPLDGSQPRSPPTGSSPSRCRLSKPSNQQPVHSLIDSASVPVSPDSERSIALNQRERFAPPVADGADRLSEAPPSSPVRSRAQRRDDPSPSRRAHTRRRRYRWARQLLPRAPALATCSPPSPAPSPVERQKALSTSRPPLGWRLLV